MVYILAASSVHHEIDAFKTEQQSKYKDKVYAIPSLCLILTRKIEEKLQILLPTNLEDKTEIVVWPMCWKLAFVDIEVIITDPYQYRIW